MYERLQKLGLCLSHSRTIKLVDALGDNYDSKVKDWKAAAEELFVNSSLSVSEHQSCSNIWGKLINKLSWVFGPPTTITANDYMYCQKHW